jgi:eukaryotic-like serine/threonine-protein kinase
MNDATEILTEKDSEQIHLNAPPRVSESLPFPLSQLKGDLDNIILTALRKEPSRRYQSAEDLSKDISNYLNGLPVTARPNTFFYRAEKFYHRNKTASIVGLFLALSLIGGIIATSWQAVVASRERDRAEKRFQDVRKLSNSLLFEITPKIERLQGSTEAREVLVKRALEYLDSLAVESNNDLELQSELASAYETIGALQGHSTRPNLGDFTGATESLLKANKIRQNLPKTEANQILLAENYRTLADVRFEQNETAKAEQETNEALKIYQELLKQNPASNELKLGYTKTLIDLAQLYQFIWKLNKSIEISYQTRAEIAKLNQDVRETKELSITNLTDLAYALSWNEKQKEAEIEMAKAVELAEFMAAKYPNDVKNQRQAWRTLTQASGIYESIKDDISLQFAEKALNFAVKAVQNDPADMQAKQDLFRSHYRKAICLTNLKKFPEAVSALQTAEKILTELIEKESKNKVYQVEMARLYTTFGETNLKTDNLADALKYFQNAVEIREKILQADSQNTNTTRDLAIGFKNIADTNIKFREKDKAKANYEKSLEFLTRLKNNNSLSEFDNKILDEVTKKLAEVE